MINSNRDLIACLDVGTSKVVIIVAELLSDGELKIIGFGKSNSAGIKNGLIININEAVVSINEAIKEAELLVGEKISSVYTGISGEHLQSINQEGVLLLRENYVSKLELAEVTKMANYIDLPSDRIVIFSEVQEFNLDGQITKNPINLDGKKLIANVHLITADKNKISTLNKVLRLCGLEIKELFINNLASSTAILNNEESKRGLALIDIGGGTSDLTIFSNGCICHNSSIPMAGNLITSDIAYAFNTSNKEAEEIKINYGNALSEIVEANDFVEVINFINEEELIDRKFLAEVIEARLTEIFTIINEKIQETNLSVNSIIFTGGVANLNNSLDLAKKIFQKPVKLGLPNNEFYLTNLSVLNQTNFATVFGILKLAQNNYNNKNKDINPSTLIEFLKQKINKIQKYLSIQF